VAVLASFQPDTLRVQRSVTIAAPAAKVFPFVDDFKRWAEWSPFEHIDPTMRRNYGTPVAGKERDLRVGRRRQGRRRQDDDRRIDAAVEGRHLARLRAPDEGPRGRRVHVRAAGQRDFRDLDDGSRHNFVSKVMCLFLDPEKLIGDDFARGLAALKAVAERYVGGSGTNRAIDAVWRIESAKVIASLARMLRDVGLAEELAQDALVAALETWPDDGVPDNPGAWLMATAKRRALDVLRRRKLLERKHEELAYELELDQELANRAAEAAQDDEIGDDLLRLVFTACHPVLSPDARSRSRSSCWAASRPTRSRARSWFRSRRSRSASCAPSARSPKRACRSRCRRATRSPSGSRRSSRSSTSCSTKATRRPRATTGCARNYARRRCASAASSPSSRRASPRCTGSCALMEIQQSRVRARQGPGGEPILLLDQERGRWDRLLIGRGLAALARAEALGGSLGRYALQGAIAACHARAATAEETDWQRIAALYDALAQIAPSPVVELNRASPSRWHSVPPPALPSSTALADERTLEGYHLLPSVRGDLLAKLGRHREARAEFERAAGLTRNARERELHARACRPGRAECRMRT
jgi:predicted RNA polymerase sigma factor